MILSLAGTSITIAGDLSTSVAVRLGMEKSYRLHELDLDESSTVVDIGACNGIVSIYLAKRYGCKIYAYEPMRGMYDLLLGNAALNNVSDKIVAINKAVSKDGRDLVMKGNFEVFPGTVSVFGEGPDIRNVKSISIADFITDLDIIDLLKINCEGMEYEILVPDVLDKVRILAGEFHFVSGGNPHDLKTLVEQYVSDCRLSLRLPRRRTMSASERDMQTHNLARSNTVDLKPCECKDHKRMIITEVKKDDASS